MGRLRSGKVPEYAAIGLRSGVMLEGRAFSWFSRAQKVAAAATYYGNTSRLPNLSTSSASCDK